LICSINPHERELSCSGSPRLFYWACLPCFWFWSVFPRTPLMTMTSKCRTLKNCKTVPQRIWEEQERGKRGCRDPGIALGPVLNERCCWEPSIVEAACMPTKGEKLSPPGFPADGKPVGAACSLDHHPHGDFKTHPQERAFQSSICIPAIRTLIAATSRSHKDEAFNPEPVSSPRP
jgi:hypothetical protein